MSLTIQSNETDTEYLLFQYLRDPFRREAKNIGVAVHRGGKTLCRFFAQTTAAVDGRRLGWVNVDTYKQWVGFWTRAAQKPDWRERLLSSSKQQFVVLEGGALMGSRGDDLEQVVDFLFARLVDGQIEDLDQTEEEKSFGNLNFVVRNLFRDNGLLTSPTRVLKASIYAERDLIGASRPYRFQYVQLNGVKRPMEIFDFEHGAPKQLDYHAAWAATAFADTGRVDPLVSAFTLYCPPESLQKRKTFEDALQLLEPVSKTVNMSNSMEQADFIDDCRRCAGLLV